MRAMNRTILAGALAGLLSACSGGDDGGDGGSATGGGSGTGTGGAAPTGGAGPSGGTSGASPSGGTGTGGASGSAGSGGGGECPTGTIMAQAANNYTFASDISVKPVMVQPGSELTFDWSGLTTDFLGRTVSPTADIDSVLLVVLGLTPEELEMHINADNDLQPYNRGALQLITNNTLSSSSLYDFGVPGQPEATYRTSPDVQATVDEYLDPAVTDPATHVMAVMPTTGVALGRGSRMVQVLRLDASSTTTDIDIGASTVLPSGTDGHTGATDGPAMSLTYDVELQALTPTRVPAGTSAITIDWTGLTMNGLGRPWVERSIDRIVIGHYTQSLEELENEFLDLEGIADRLYFAEVPSDEPFSLASLVDDQGQAFAGVDGTGVWILALSCTFYCSNPAPWYLTILAPCE